MNSRELVYRTLNFDSPARLPRHLWLLPWANITYPKQLKRIQQQFPDDITAAPMLLKTSLKTQGQQYKIGTYIDEWGCVFDNAQDGIIGEVKVPLIQTWQDLDKMREPIEALSVDVQQVNDFCNNTDKFVLSACYPRPFERLQFLRGTENVMMDLALERPEIFTVLDRLHQFNLKELEVWAQTDVDGLTFIDDWGAQRSLLISPDMWRRIFKPLYKDYIDLAKAFGKKTFMHSDGYIMDIIPDLIEIGLDALNSQVFCMGLDELSEQFKGKITFWGEIDRQHLLPNGSPAELAAAAEKFCHCFYQNGGAIAQLEFGPGAKPENVQAVFQAFDTFKTV